ncbi:MAG: hypothetical protein HY556_00760 [Euryarchaeota archaeon]|nr:hypothetical protein [Euryarchaeota archaeon]
MDLAWNPLGAIGIVVGVLACAMAALVWKARADRAQNRWLAAYLFGNGLYFVAYNGLRLFATDPRDAYALMASGWSVNLLSVGGYFAFLSTLDSPLVSWMRRYRIVWAVMGGSALVAAYVVVQPGAWFPGVQPLGGFSGWGAVSSPLRNLVLLVLTGLFIFSAAPAIDAWRRAKTPLLRRQGWIFGATFATTSLGWAAFIIWYLASGTGTFTPFVVVVNFLWQALLSLALSLGLAYGILKTQLFDVDIKLKWTLRSGTLAGAFLGVFFVASEAAQSVLSAQLGPIVGLVATGALVFALAPLQRAADRIADKAMPRVSDDAEYRTVRKREVYAAAVESALEEGDIRPKERGMLATLADQLGLGPKEMHEIEVEARSERARVA